jgi:hypothetical protein
MVKNIKNRSVKNLQGKNTLQNNNLSNNTNFSLNIFNTLSNNKLLIGIVAIFVNIGSRYIPLNLTKNQEALLKNISTELLIFSITLLMSRDIITAILLTAAFTIMTRYIFNENSKLCILPEEYKNVTKLIDTNKDGVISVEEMENAKKLLTRFNEQQELHNKIFMLNNFQ